MVAKGGDRASYVFFFFFFFGFYSLSFGLGFDLCGVSIMDDDELLLFSFDSFPRGFFFV